MTSIDCDIIHNAPGSTHVVNCHHCRQKFNPSAASWCRCDGKSRTLICPHCSTCFCRAPTRYKEEFWEEAPRALRENTNRFRIGDGTPNAVPGGSAATGPEPPPRVLVVDDEEDFRSLVACYVEQMGYDVVSVSSPKSALDVLASATFDVVITDALMPGMDGRDLCQKLKATYGKGIKVIVMTSLYTASRYRTEARHRFGVDEYLAKPLRFGVLKAALDRVAPIIPRGD